MKFEQNWLRGFRGGCLKMFTDRQTDAWTDDGRKVITLAHPEHSSGELKTGFQDGGYGCHFGFPISMILAYLHLHVNLLLHHKFQLNSPCGL